MQIYHHRSTKNLSLVFFSPFSSTPSTLLPLHTLGSLQAKCEMRWNGMRERKERIVKEKKTFQIFFLSALILDSTAYCCCILMWMKRKKVFSFPNHMFYFLLHGFLPPSVIKLCVYFSRYRYERCWCWRWRFVSLLNIGKREVLHSARETHSIRRDAAFSSSFNVNIYVDCGTFPIAPRISSM